MCVKDSSINTINNNNNNNQEYIPWSQPAPLFEVSNPTTCSQNDQEFASEHTISASSVASLSDEQEVVGDSMPCKTKEQDLPMEDIHTTDDDEEEEEQSINSNSSINHKNNNKKTRSPTLRRHSKCGGGGGEMTEHRTVVEHKYHDHYHDALSIVVCGGAGSISSSNNSSGSDGNNNHLLVTKRPPGSARGGVTMAFPERLHEMLTTVEDEGLSDVISWQPHGRCFLIHKKSIFVEEVMPRFFHQTKLTSFQRQLNLYGFVRLTAGRDRGGYYHECFLRGRADLCRCMVRTRVKGNGMKAASSPDTEPNFYAMEPCVEDHQHHHPEPRQKTTMIESDIIMSNDNTESSTRTTSSTSSRSRSRNSSSSSRARKSRSSSTMFPSLDQAVAVELDEMYSNEEEAAVMLKSRPEEEEDSTTDVMDESCSIMPHVSFSSDFPMMDIVSSMSSSFPSSSLLATMVSPPESPNLNAKKPLYISNASIHDIVESALDESDDDFDMMSPPYMPLHLPHSGDAVFFEGLKFRYLDHLDLVTNHVSDDDIGEDETGATASV